MGSISKFETDLCDAADNLRANSKLTSVDAEKIETDRRLPFGLPGLNKDKKVSNGRSMTIDLWD